MPVAWHKNCVYSEMVIRVISICLLFLCGSAEAASHYYLLSKPMTSTAKIWFPLRTGHYLLEGGIQLAIVAGVVKTSGSVFAGLPFVVTGLAKLPIFVRADSLAHLKALGLESDLKYVWKLSKIPGLLRVVIVSGANDERDFFKVLVKSQTRTGMVFIETNDLLPDNTSALLETKQWRQEWGEPISLEDLETTKLKLRMKMGERLNPVEWTPSISEIFAHAKVPTPIAAQWRQMYQDARSELAPRFSSEKNPFVVIALNLKEFITKRASESLSFEASLIDKDGNEIPIGKFVQSGAATKLIRMNLLSRLSDRMRWARHLPLLPEASLPIFNMHTKDGFCRGIVRAIIDKYSNRHPKPSNP